MNLTRRTVIRAGVGIPHTRGDEPTAQLGKAWAGEFGAWPQLPGLLGTVTRWLQISPAQYSASVTAEGHRLRVVVDAVLEGLYLVDENLEAQYGRERVRLEQTGPGRYEGLLEAPADGGTVMIARDNEIVARSAVNLPNVAFDASGAGAFLREIVRRTDGEIVPEPGVYSPAFAERRREIGVYFMTAALLLFLLELAYRRLVSRETQIG